MRTVSEPKLEGSALQKALRIQGLVGVMSLGDSSLKWSSDYVWSISDMMGEGKGE